MIIFFIDGSLHPVCECKTLKISQSIVCMYKCRVLCIVLYYIHCFCSLMFNSAATNNVRISIVLTVLALPGSDGIFGRNLFEGETLVTPEVLSEVTDAISETTSDLGYQANVTQPARLGTGCMRANWKFMHKFTLSLSLSPSLPPSLPPFRWLCH